MSIHIHITQLMSFFSLDWCLDWSLSINNLQVQRNYSSLAVQDIWIQRQTLPTDLCAIGSDQ